MNKLRVAVQDVRFTMAQTKALKKTASESSLFRRKIIASFSKAIALPCKNFQVHSQETRRHFYQETFWYLSPFEPKNVDNNPLERYSFLALSRKHFNSL